MTTERLVTMTKQNDNITEQKSIPSDVTSACCNPFQAGKQHFTKASFAERQYQDYNQYNNSITKSQRLFVEKSIPSDAAFARYSPSQTGRQRCPADLQRSAPQCGVAAG